MKARKARKVNFFVCFSIEAPEGKKAHFVCFKEIVQPGYNRLQAVHDASEKIQKHVKEYYKGCFYNLIHVNRLYGNLNRF